MEKERGVSLVVSPICRKKKGLSTIITTLLIILIAIVLIAIIWIIVRLILERDSEISAIKASLIGENIEVIDDEINQSNNLSLSITLQKKTGKIITEGSIEIQGQSPQVDVMSVVDLSGSMAVCEDITLDCCAFLYNEGMDPFAQVTVRSTSIGSESDLVDGIINTTNSWASSSTGPFPHRITMDFIVGQVTVSNITIWWGWNATTSRYMTSQQVEIQYADAGYVFQPLVTFNSGGAQNISNSTIILPQFSTQALRFVQQSGMGPPSYPNIMWISEIQLNNATTTPPYDCTEVPKTSLNNCEPICGGNLIDRINPLINANKALVSEIFTGSNNKVGLSAYRGSLDSSNSSGLVTNSGILVSKIDSWEAWGATCICCGINNASAEFGNNSVLNKQKVMIVMSDGLANFGCGGAGTPAQQAINAACNASIQNLTIHSVGIEPTADAATLQAIANCGNGTYYASNGSIDNLTNIYTTIAGQSIQQSKTIQKYNFLRFVFFDSSSNTAVVDKPAPEILQVTKYDFDLTTSGLVAPIIKVEIYPIVILSSGREVAGPLLETWEFEEE